ncbi:hypothetical protein QCA50_016577 [Cerrena zonata]|uniref:Uncharacterized protein n=1 Tax=Cerrena zonata TaxID=2478898 RepID=A0AAW0FSR4_9APHY
MSLATHSNEKQRLGAFPISSEYAQEPSSLSFSIDALECSQFPSPTTIYRPEPPNYTRRNCDTTRNPTDMGGPRYAHTLPRARPGCPNPSTMYIVDTRMSQPTPRIIPIL